MNSKERFKRVANRLGWNVTEWVGSEQADFVMMWATPEETDEPSATYSVLVVDRETAEKGEETWIEFRTTGGEAGWLYGDADMFAFEQEDRFTLVERDKLRDWLEEFVTKTYVTLAHQALMNVYKKQDGSMLTLMKSYHLKGLAMGEMRDV